MTEDEKARVWARLFMEERRKGNPNALHRADARLVLEQMKSANARQE